MAAAAVATVEMQYEVEMVVMIVMVFGENITLAAATMVAL
jgi:hypothetical protein